LKQAKLKSDQDLIIFCCIRKHISKQIQHIGFGSEAHLQCIHVITELGTN